LHDAVLVDVVVLVLVDVLVEVVRMHVPQATWHTLKVGISVQTCARIDKSSMSYNTSQTFASSKTPLHTPRVVVTVDVDVDVLVLVVVVIVDVLVLVLVVVVIVDVDVDVDVVVDVVMVDVDDDVDVLVDVDVVEVVQLWHATGQT
jgi:hypothetical protein